MENFFDHMIFVCISFVIIGLLIGVPVFIGEYILEKYNLTEKFVNFMFGEHED